MGTVKRLPDSNFWLALALEKHVNHGLCAQWLGSQTGHGSILFCRSTQQSVLRLLTTTTILKAQGLSALTNEEAWAVYEKFLEDDRIGFCEEPSGFQPIWKRYSCRTTQSPKIWMDTFLAAFAVAGGYQFVTNDAGFRQYNELDLILLEQAKPATAI